MKLLARLICSLALLLPSVGLTQTVRLPSGTSLPADCTRGDTFEKTDAGLGQKIYIATASSPSCAWEQQGSGSSGVTSVAESFTGGLISVAGSPITSSGTFALTVAGTSGGIPYFSSSSAWASSAALTAHGVVLGGGAGAAPVSTGAGTTGQVLTSNGASSDPTFQTVSGTTGSGTSGTITAWTGSSTLGNATGFTLAGTNLTFAASNTTNPTELILSNTATTSKSVGRLSVRGNNGAVESVLDSDGLGSEQLSTPALIFGTTTNHPIGFISNGSLRATINADGSTIWGNTGGAARLRTSLATPSSLSNGDWWVECTGTTPTRVCAIKVRDGGVTITIASVTN